ncbi:MAG: helicase-related protein, partial [Bacteroidia bacterium]|nr:helicase-related protein [Bacteroidia bacterium]
FHPEMYGIVFTRTKNEAQDIAEALKKADYNAESLHGDLQQPQRERVTNLFRQRHVQILVATDVAARGLDVHDLTHVVHYMLPDDAETYIHRTGRTARAGKSGVSISIVSRSQVRWLNQLRHELGVNFEKRPIPSPQEVIAGRIAHFLDRFVAMRPDEAAVEKHLPLFTQKLQDLGREEIIKRLCWLELNHFLTAYSNARDLNVRETPARPAAKNGSEVAAHPRCRRFKINLGERDGLDKFDLIAMISEATQLPKSHINRVRVDASHSFFELFDDEADHAVEQLRECEFEGRPVRVVAVESASKRGDERTPRLELKRKFKAKSKYAE